MAKKITYAKRDFAGLREELVDMTKQYYPDLIKNFNDASIYSVILDMNAAVSDNLHFHIDRVWQETMLDFAQQKQSLYHIAKTYGLRVPGVRPSIALCDFSINVPVRGDKDDVRYEGTLRAGAQVSGGGQIFETIDDIDFSSPFPPCKNNNKGKFEFDSSYPSGKIILYLIGLGTILDSRLKVEYFFIIHFTCSYLTILTLFFPFNSISFSPMLAILRDNSEIFHFS